MKLSPAMERAIADALPDGTISGASRATEYALIRRGLAVAVYGEESFTRYGHSYNRYNVYLGARLVASK
jgi:hypothetical protein